MNPAYPAARVIAPKLFRHFSQIQSLALENRIQNVAPLPSERVIEALVDVAFWTSLRREEQYPPRISLAYLPPDEVHSKLLIEPPISLNPAALTRLAPGVERPGIHLGVWEFDGELKVWGATRNLSPFCFTAETVAPGLVVIKHRQTEGAQKFVNVAVLEGDQIKILNHEFLELPGCFPIIGSILGSVPTRNLLNSSNVLLRLAVSMRDHKRGGTLLVVPPASDNWRKSIAHPISYSVNPGYLELADVIREEPPENDKRRWKDALSRAVDAVAGLTAIDGATLITEQCEVLAFGAKIIRPDGSAPPESVALIEPIEGAAPQVIPLGQLGGTRHISAAVFASIQRDAIAMVASQDGPFTIFAWSSCDDLVYGYRVEALLL